MVSDKEGARGRSRRELLKAGGMGAFTMALAGCQEGVSDGTGEPETTAGTTAGDGDGAGTTNEGGDGGDGEFVAEPAAIDTAFTAEASDLVEATFAEQYYTPLDGGLPGIEVPEGTTPVGHAVTYGHEMVVPGEETDVQPRLRRLSAGVVSVPGASVEEGSNRYAEASLAELVAEPEGNLLFAAAGLGPTVEWLTEPVSIERTETEFIEGVATVETFVGAVAAEPGPGMPGAEAVGHIDRDGRQVGQYMMTMHTARGTVGGSVVMLGMISGWRRPPTMGPPPTEIGPEMAELLSEVYQDVVEAELFRRVLGRTGMLAGALMPDPEDRPPRPKTEKVAPDVTDDFGLGEVDQIELGYPDEEAHSERLLDMFVVGRNGPDLFDQETWDEDKHDRGTKYFVKPQTRGLAYPLARDGTFPFGVVVSPRIEIEGKERNPLAADPLPDAMTGFDGLWDLLRWAGNFGDMEWGNGPNEFDQVSGLSIWGESATAKGFEGSIRRVSPGGGTSFDDASVYVARATTPNEVIVAVALNFDSEPGYFDRDESAKRLFENAVGRVVEDPDTPSTWVDGSIDGMNLVQRARNTRLETGSGDMLGRSDPPLVEGLNVAPPFDVSTFSGTALSSNELEYGVFQFDVGNRSGAPFETVLDRSAIDDLDTGSIDPDVLFDNNRVNDSDPANDLPVFELQDTDDSVTLEFKAPSGYSYDTTTLRAGSDFQTSAFEVLRVGFITISDPEDGTNYGDGNGGPTNYPTTVDAAFEYLKRTYPTGIAAYRHDAAIEGVTPIFSNNATQNETKDYRNARVALERIAKPGNNNWTYTGDTMAHGISESDAESQIKNNGFDVWVLVPPNGYYQFHRNDRPSGLAPWNDDLAVTAIEGDRNGRARAAETVAQEIGHRMERSPYQSPTSGGGWQNPLCQRDDDGTNTANRDFDHARHLSSNNDGSTPADGPGLVSRAYSLAEGEFVVPTHTAWNSGYNVWNVTNRPNAFGRYGPNNTFGRLDRMESYMSYSPRSVWADSMITQDIIQSDLQREAGNFQTFQLAGGLTEVSASAAGGDSGSEANPSMSGVQVVNDWVVEPDEERLEAADTVVEVELYGPGGEVVASTRAPAEEGVDGHEVEDGRLAGDTSFQLEFHPDAVEMQVTAETGEIQANPITRPILDAYGRIPPEGLTADPAEIEAQIQDLVGRVQEDMGPGAYADARDELVTFLEQELESTIDPEYEPLENQPDTARMTALFEEMINRLDGLAD